MYTIVPAQGGYFMLPAKAAECLRLAGAAQLRALIAIYSRMGAPVAAEEIAKEIGLSTPDVRDALLFWEEKGLIARTDAPPAPVPEAEKPPVPAKAAEQPAGFANPKPEANQLSAEEKRIPKIKPTTAQINSRCQESPEIRELFLQAQHILGRTIGYDTQAQLLLCCDYLGLPVSVVLMICEYARSVGKTGISYIVRTAENWAEAGICTLEAANKKIAALEESGRLWKEFAERVGITAPSPSRTQSEYIQKWTDDFGFDLPVLLLAYDEMADHTGKFSLAYMNKTLTAWHERGLKNAAAVKAYLEEYKQKAAQTLSARAPAKKTNANRQPETAVSYDIQSAEQKAALGAPVYERKKKK